MLISLVGLALMYKEQEFLPAILLVSLFSLLIVHYKETIIYLTSWFHFGSHPLFSTGKPTKTPTRPPTRQPTWKPTLEPTITPTAAIASNATKIANMTIDNNQSDEIQGQERPADTDTSSPSKDGSGATSTIFVASKWHSTLFVSLLLAFT